MEGILESSSARLEPIVVAAAEQTSMLLVPVLGYLSSRTYNSFLRGMRSYIKAHTVTYNSNTRYQSYPMQS